MTSAATLTPRENLLKIQRVDAIHPVHGTRYIHHSCGIIRKHYSRTLQSEGHKQKKTLPKLSKAPLPATTSSINSSAEPWRRVSLYSINGKDIDTCMPDGENRV